jgi:hypothetical protein
LLTTFTRYLQISYFIEKNEYLKKSIRKLNVISLILGMTACLGIQLVGNFQETNVVPAHFLGALISFGIGTLYMLVQVFHEVYKTAMKLNLNFQSVMSFYLKRFLRYKYKHYIRMTLSLLCLAFLIITITFGVLSHRYPEHKKGSWMPSEPGWIIHVISTSFEWLLAFTFNFYILSFKDDFYGIRYHPIRVSDNFLECSL